MQTGIFVTMCHRQHGHADFGVLQLAIERQRPEMGWRPCKNDEKQQQCVGGDFPGHCRPAKYRRHCAGSTADDYVLRRHRLQYHRVDDGITDESRQGQPHGQGIHQLVQYV